MFDAGFLDPCLSSASSSFSFVQPRLGIELGKPQHAPTGRTCTSGACTQSSHSKSGDAALLVKLPKNIKISWSAVLCGTCHWHSPWLALFFYSRARCSSLKLMRNRSKHTIRRRRTIPLQPTVLPFQPRRIVPRPIHS